MTIERRLEKINKYDMERGVLRSMRKIQDRIAQNLDLIKVTEDEDVIVWLLEEIENDKAEIVYMSSSLMFEKDILFMVQGSSIYRRMEE